MILVNEWVDLRFSMSLIKADRHGTQGIVGLPFEFSCCQKQFQETDATAQRYHHAHNRTLQPQHF